MELANAIKQIAKIYNERKDNIQTEDVKDEVDDRQ
jgi:hypothetical protein